MGVRRAPVEDGCELARTSQAAPEHLLLQLPRSLAILKRQELLAQRLSLGQATRW
jgi:hypothetical protein